MSSPRVRPCTRHDARVRATTARRFLDTAALIRDEEDPASVRVVTALAVLAGIAASDALCCATLGQLPRGQDHRQATALLATVRPDGQSHARQLAALLDLKDHAHYGTTPVTAGSADTALRRATRLVAAAEEAAIG